ncbi:nucleotidyltransferase family protein [Tropicimonas sp.]|uniref:nucleotidyltransferase family protein n=1 Tax=Tropicimonas sp. TaxID=2067044 RepID=UPI003A8858C1
MTTVGLLLAAGRSRRFGPEDKLLAGFAGAPLVSHAARALAGCGFDHLLAAVCSARVAALLAEYECVRLDATAAAQSDSLRAGVSRAAELGADRLVIVLGDMPNLTSHLIRRVADTCGAGLASAATDGTCPMPPACFPSGSFAALSALSGDRGAGSLLRDLPAGQLVRATANDLLDFDTPEALARAEANAARRRNP